MDNYKVESKDAVFGDKGRVKVCQRALLEMSQLLSNLGPERSPEEWDGRNAKLGELNLNSRSGSATA